MNYGVVIVTYNRLELLKECLSCVINQSIKFKEIIVVDNCSEDSTNEYLQSIVKIESESNIKYFRLEKNLGGAGGFNFALSKVSDDIDWVLIIDDDAMLEYNYIEEINKVIPYNNYYAYSGAVISDGDIDTTHRRILTNKMFLKKKDVEIEKYKNDSFEYDLSTFCGLVVKRKLINTIGLPNKDYFIWYDDTEYSLRINNYSKILNVNKAKLNHKAAKSMQLISWKSYYGARNSIHMGRIHSSNRFLFLMYSFIYCLLRIMKNVLRVIFIKNRRAYGIACVKIYKDVLIDSFHGRLGIKCKYLPGK
jgi:hypothetical protein